MKVINGSGEYVSKKTGQKVGYTYDYVQYDTIQELIEEHGEAKVLSLAQRMLKLDAANPAREHAKTQNGDSTRKVMSEEEKAQGKVERAQNKALLDKIKALTPEQRSALGL